MNLNKVLILLGGILLNIFLIHEILAYSTYGAPAEFGNASLTTCFIGGDKGILNCTGNITGSYFFGNGSQLTGITSTTAQNLECTDCLGTPQIADVYLQLVGGSMIGNILMPGHNLTADNISANRLSGNGSGITNANASYIDCNNIDFSGTIGSASICDGDDAYGSGAGGGGQGMWEDIGSWIQPNATFAVNVNVTGDLKIQDGDLTCSACINPEDINDIDKENIETDLNTFVDIAGDIMTGPLFSSANFNTSKIINASEIQISGVSLLGLFLKMADAWNKANFTSAFSPAYGSEYASTGFKKANMTTAYPNFDTDSTNDVTSVSGSSPISSTGGTTPTISMSQATTSSHGYLTSTDWNTFNNKGSGTVTAVTGTSPIASSGGTTPAISIALADTNTNGFLSSTDWNIFNSKSSYTAADDLVGSIAEWDSECTDCVGTDDVATGACDNNCLIASPTFTSPIIETNIAADAAGGANLGTSSTEWGHIYIGTNYKIYLGDASDGQIYYDGSRLVIKVTS